MSRSVGRRSVQVQKVGSKNRLTVSGRKVGDFSSKRVANKIGRFRARS
jgi:hypothetical protein